MSKYFTQRNIYITLFALLYFSTALVSTIHAVSFFCLANVLALGVLLAVTFEIGQAATLFSILTSKKERSKIMPWVLMFILTGVQILGNVYSSYKYLISNSADLLRYFKEPIFVWMELPDAQANVILTYIIGAVLPVVALALTGMLTNYLEDNKTNEQETKEVKTDNKTNEYENTEAITEPIALPDDLVITKPVEEEQIEITTPTPEEIQYQVEAPIETPTEKPTEIPTESPEVKQVNELMDNNIKSHFVNLK